MAFLTLFPIARSRCGALSPPRRVTWTSTTRLFPSLQFGRTKRCLEPPRPPSRKVMARCAAAGPLRLSPLEQAMLEVYGEGWKEKLTKGEARKVAEKERKRSVALDTSNPQSGSMLASLVLSGSSPTTWRKQVNRRKLVILAGNPPRQKDALPVIKQFMNTGRWPSAAGDPEPQQGSEGGSETGSSQMTSQSPESSAGPAEPPGSDPVSPSQPTNNPDTDLAGGAAKQNGSQAVTQAEFPSRIGQWIKQSDMSCRELKSKRRCWNLFILKLAKANRNKERTPTAADQQPGPGWYDGPR